MANKMRDKGIAIANLAVDADNAGNYKDAIEKYGKATEYLITAHKYEKNPVTQKTIREKCNEYLSRMDQLKKGQEPKAAAAGSGGGKGKEESRSDDEPNKAAMVDEEFVMIARNPLILRIRRQAMAKLNETIENIGKKEEHLQRKIDAELAHAKKFQAAGEKLEALQCLEKRKMYELQLATLGTSKIDLVKQRLTLESMEMKAEILDAQRMVAKSMAEILDAIKCEVGGIEADTQRIAAKSMAEIDDAMNCEVGHRASAVHLYVGTAVWARPAASQSSWAQRPPRAHPSGDYCTQIPTALHLPGIEADDDQHFAEFDGHMEEELAADSSKVDLGRAVKKPSAPISLPAAGTKKIMTAEERELAELEAALAG